MLCCGKGGQANATNFQNSFQHMDRVHSLTEVQEILVKGSLSFLGVCLFDVHDFGMLGGRTPPKQFKTYPDDAFKKHS